MHTALKTASGVADNFLDPGFLDIWTTPTNIPDFLLGRTRHRQFSSLSVAPVLQWGHMRKKEYINKIPVELLGEIFKSCVLDSQGNPAKLSSYWKHGSSKPVHPLLLGQVCALWRQIMNSMPSLWSTIYIDRPTRQDARLLPLWLEKSKPCTLSVEISQSRRDLYTGFQVNHNSATTQILSLLIPHLHRVRRLDLSLHYEAEMIENIPIDAAPVLESLKLDFTYLAPEYIYRACRGLSASPLLRRCALDWHENLVPSSIPWSQLTEISINVRLRVEELVKILRQCAQVKFLTFGRLDVTTPRLSPPVVLQHLQHLRINTIDCALVFDCITVPSLVSVDTGGYLMNFEKWAALDRMVCRSSCHLKKWKCHYGHTDESRMVDGLGSVSLQTVTHVKFPFRASERLLLALSLKDMYGRHVYLPSLQSMTTWAPQAEEAVIARFISSRNNQLSKSFEFITT